MSFFYKKPKHSTVKGTNVGDALGSLKAFNAMVEAGYSGSETASIDNCDYDDNYKANWRKSVYDGVINTGGEATEIDFFERALGFDGKKTMDVDASELFIKYRGAKDYNIASAVAAQATAPGQPVVFTLLKSMHSFNGKYSNVAKGGMLYIYEDGRTLTVTDVNTTVDYAHVVTAVPRSKDYQANVRKGVKMMFNPVRTVDGYSCPIPQNTWDTPGYIQSVKPYLIEKNWSVPINLLRPFEEVMQFALAFDREGGEIDNYEWLAKSTARDEFKYMRNLLFFLGEKTDNPLLISDQGDQYTGFMGLHPTLLYAGGTVYDVEASGGFDLDVDFQTIMGWQNAQKKSKEFLLMHGQQFWYSMNRASEAMFAKSTGQCTFDTFKRTGASMEDIQRMGIQSYTFHNRTVHFHEVDAWTDERALGAPNGPFPYTGIMMPTTGIKTSNGRDVPPIEFFQPGGEFSGYTEIDRDMRHINGCKEFQGDITETLMMAVHGPENMILLNPIMNQ